MLKVLLTTIVAVLDELLSKENLKLVGRAMLDAAEAIVVESENTIDDEYVLPRIRKLREAFGLDDDDDPA